jgi:hypothetical protein
MTSEVGRCNQRKTAINERVKRRDAQIGMNDVYCARDVNNFCLRASMLLFAFTGWYPDPLGR